MSNVHVKYSGTSYDIDFDELFSEDRRASLGIAADAAVSPETVADRQIWGALSYHFDRDISEFQEMYIEKNPNGNITVRPQATFG